MGIRSMSAFGAVLLCVGMAAGFVGCAEEDQDACSASVQRSLDRIPRTTSGTIILNFAGTNVGVDVRASLSTDGCNLDLTLVNFTNSACSEAFLGPLTMTSPNQWTGDRILGNDADTGTVLDITMTHRERDIVELNAKITDSNIDICKDAVLKGRLSAEN